MYWLVGLGFLGGAWAAPLLIDGYDPLLIWVAATPILGALLTRGHWERLTAGALAAACLGLLVASLRIHPLPEIPSGPVSVSATVEQARLLGAGEELSLSALRLDGGEVAGRLLVRERVVSGLREGDQVAGSLTLTRPEPLPHGWRARGIVASSSSPRLSRLGHHGGLLTSFSELHQRVSAEIGRLLADPEAGFLGGILLGDRAEIAPGLQTALNRTGTTHLIAVSGFNVAVVVAFIWLLRGWVPYRLLLGLSAVGVIGFVALVGPSSSVVRAAIMGCLVLLAKGLGRPAAAGRLLIAAAVLMAAYNPWVLHDDLGFGLSFAATAGIIWLEPLLTPRLARLFPPALAGLLGATLAAQIATEPLLVASFGRLSFISLLVNAIVIPLVPLGMLAGTVMVLGGAISPFFGELLSWITWPLLHGMLATIEAGSRLPGVLERIGWSSWLTGPVYLAMILGAWLVGRRGRRET